MMNQCTENIAVAMMFSGFAVNAVAVATAVVWKKDGVAINDLFWAGSGLAAHCEWFVRPDRVMMVRILFHSAVGLFLAGVLMLLVTGLCCDASLRR